MRLEFFNFDSLLSASVMDLRGEKNVLVPSKPIYLEYTQRSILSLENKSLFWPKMTLIYYTYHQSNYASCVQSYVVLVT